MPGFERLSAVERGAALVERNATGAVKDFRLRPVSDASRPE